VNFANTANNLSTLLRQESIMQLSTRNQWPGTVKAINNGNIVSEVILELAPNISVTAIVSRASIASLGLEVGSKAYALIKSTEVTLAID
jgi:molybdate transport system regulatory protein